MCHLQGKLLEAPCFDLPEAAHAEAEIKEDAKQLQSAIGLRLETGNWQFTQEKACFKQTQEGKCSQIIRHRICCLSGFKDISLCVQLGITWHSTANTEDYGTMGSSCDRELSEERCIKIPASPGIWLS